MDFTRMFSPYSFEKIMGIVLRYLIDEWNWQNKLDWSDKIQIKWNKQDWKLFSLSSRKLTKYVAAFDYIDKF